MDVAGKGTDARHHSDASSRWRLLTAARVFALAGALGLALSTGQHGPVAIAYAILCCLAATMSLAATWSQGAIAPVVEGLVVGMVLAAFGGSASSLLVYLVVPPLAGGLVTGTRTVFLVVVAEVAGAVGSSLASRPYADLPPALEALAPWLLAGLGLGLLGAWVRTGAVPAASEQQRYEFAHRLLARLHTVAKELPHGLDGPSLAQRTLAHAVAGVEVSWAVLLLRSADDSLRELATHGDGQLSAPSYDALVSTCWQTRKAQHDRSDDATGTPHRVVLPLRVDSRMVGVVVMAAEAPVAARALRKVQARLDERSLRLESAMLFEQVRSMATVEERHRLAREIHDGIAQEVASLGYLVDDLAATSTTDEGRQAAANLRAELTRIVNELRLSIFDLRAHVNESGGLGQALSDYARDVGTRAGMTVHLALAETSQRLPTDVETELLRIAQEAITNARKHARANNLWVTLNTNGSVTLLRIEDDGNGAVQSRNHHYGLRMMQERAERIGADLVISKRPRGGTSVVVVLQPPNLTIPGAHRDHLSPSR